MVAPDLSKTVPKTITAIGKINAILNLSKIFDILPLFEEDNFRVIRYKHEGVMRESVDGGVVKESDTEFKNSITMEIEDVTYGKVRAIKVYCGGLHMCGHRSIERARNLCNIIIKHISLTDAFIRYLAVASDWSVVEKHPFYSMMKPVMFTILPENSSLNDTTKEQLKRFFVGLVHEGGLFQKPIDQSELQMLNLDTVMINYSYSIDKFIHNRFKHNSKDVFIRSFMNVVRDMAVQDFDIFVHYDSLSSPMGWSGSIPLKFVHKPTGKTQWMTLQLRRGTVINSGPTVEIMQKAVDILFSILDGIPLGRDPIVNVN
jgi:hypothetical protein